MPDTFSHLYLKATHLITGDRTHFGHLCGKSIEGVKILTPREFLDEQGSPSSGIE